MRTYSMGDMLAYSRGVREETDIATIQSMIDGCVSVTKTDESTDRRGIDYIASLSEGAALGIDAKTRQPGCSKYWYNGPELALEIWSVKPSNGFSGKKGWTLNQATNVDYILFTWPPEDCDLVFLYPFQHLRMAFHHNLFSWRAGKYKIGTQDSGRWQSECMFVPERIVWDAVRQIMTGKQTREAGEVYQHQGWNMPAPKRAKPTAEDFGLEQGKLFT